MLALCWPSGYLWISKNLWLSSVLSCPLLTSPSCGLPSLSISFPYNPALCSLASLFCLLLLSTPLAPLSLPSPPLIVHLSPGHVQWTPVSPCSGLFHMLLAVLSLMPTAETSPSTRLGVSMSSFYIINNLGSKISTALCSGEIPPLLKSALLKVDLLSFQTS